MEGKDGGDKSLMTNNLGAGEEGTNYWYHTAVWESMSLYSVMPKSSTCIAKISCKGIRDTYN